MGLHQSVVSSNTRIRVIEVNSLKFELAGNSSCQIKGRLSILIYTNTLSKLSYAFWGDPLNVRNYLQIADGFLSHLVKNR